MEKKDKLLAFEYLLSKLVQWYENSSPNKGNDLSILKSLKLLFFVSSANTKSTRFSLLLDNTFNSFVAMPYGHVESEIYAWIKEKNGVLTYYTINNQSTTLNSGVNLQELYSTVDIDVALEIDKGIQTLDLFRSKLILMSAFELVELSHAWFSWQQSFKKATSKSLRSQPINPDIIKRESKVYSLHSY